MNNSVALALELEETKLSRDRLMLEMRVLNERVTYITDESDEQSIHLQLFQINLEASALSKHIRRFEKLLVELRVVECN